MQHIEQPEERSGPVRPQHYGSRLTAAKAGSIRPVSVGGIRPPVSNRFDLAPRRAVLHGFFRPLLQRTILGDQIIQHSQLRLREHDTPDGNLLIVGRAVLDLLVRVAFISSAALLVIRSCDVDWRMQAR